MHSKPFFNIKVPKTSQKYNYFGQIHAKAQRLRLIVRKTNKMLRECHITVI